MTQVYCCNRRFLFNTPIFQSYYRLIRVSKRFPKGKSSDAEMKTLLGQICSFCANRKWNQAQSEYKNVLANILRSRYVARTPPLEARAIQAAAVMLRTPPVDGQSPASQPRPLAIYGAQCWERLRHPPVTNHCNQQRAHTPRKLGFALCYHSNATGAPIANLPNNAQLGGSLYHAPSYIRVRAVVWAYGRGQTHAQTDRHTHTQTHVTTIHFASSTTHAKCKNGRNDMIIWY